MCDYNHNRPNLALIGAPVVPWGCPDGIGNIVHNSDYEDDLHVSKIGASCDIGLKTPAPNDNREYSQYMEPADIGFVKTI